MNEMSIEITEPSDIKEFVENDILTALGERVIREKNIEIGEAVVKFFLIYPCISKTVFGRCIKANRELKWFGEADYIIEFSGNTWDALSSEDKYILMYHDLLHINASYNETKGEWKYKLRKHDYTDFYTINQSYGSEWYQRTQGSHASLNEADDEHKVSI